MKDILQKLEEIQDEIAGVQAELSKAEGRYEVAMQYLQDAGFSSIKEAEESIATSDAKMQARAARLEKDFNAFMVLYREVFDGKSRD